jgi:hypothetical protein
LPLFAEVTDGVAGEINGDHQLDLDDSVCGSIAATNNHEVSGRCDQQMESRVAASFVVLQLSVARGQVVYSRARDL